MKSKEDEIPVKLSTVPIRRPKVSYDSLLYVYIGDKPLIVLRDVDDESMCMVLQGSEKFPQGSHEDIEEIELVALDNMCVYTGEVTLGIQQQKEEVKRIPFDKDNVSDVTAEIVEEIRMKKNPKI